jgi:hypothetical protein
VLRAGVEQLTKGSAIFSRRGNLYHIAFLPINFHREASFWVAGFWSAIHLIALQLTPDPISPWLLYAALYGKNGFPKDLNYIRALDPASAEILEPWFSFRTTDVIGPGFTGPIQQLLITYLQIHEASHQSILFDIYLIYQLISLVLSGDPGQVKNIIPSQRFSSRPFFLGRLIPGKGWNWKPSNQDSILILGKWHCLRSLRLPFTIIQATILWHIV